jgi:hypothetical protein
LILFLRFFGINGKPEDDEDVGKSQYFDALETIAEVEELAALKEEEEEPVEQDRNRKSTMVRLRNTF